MPVQETRHGSLSDTRRARAVAQEYVAAGVPRGKIGVRDTARGPDDGHQYRWELPDIGPRYVTVWEQPADTDDDLTPREFAAFMRVSNRLVNGHRRNYYANEDDTRCVIRHAFIDERLMSQQQPDPAEAGKNVEDPSPEQTTDETADDDSVYDRFFVHHNGGNRFTVHDDESQKTYRIDLDKVGTSDVLECIDAGPSGSHDVPQTDRAYILAAAIRAGPEYRPGPQEQLTVQVASPQGNGQSGTTSSSGSDESATSPSEVLSSPGSDHEYDPDELTENVDEWLSNYSNVKGDLVDGWWDLSFQKLTDPSNGSSDLGIHIELEPFGHSCWDGDSWSSDDAKDEWKDHQAAMRDVFQSDDNPITSFSVETDDEYDDYYNYVPAEDAQELP